MKKTYQVNQGSSIKRQLQSRAPLNHGRVPGVYRRSPGYADDGEEDASRFFHNTVCLIQAGLGGESAELLANFFKPVIALHRMVSWQCPTILQSFGGQGSLVTSSTVLQQRRGMEAQWAESLLELSGPESPAVLPIEISSLLSQEARKQIRRRSRLEKNDLILVIGKPGQFEFAEELSRTVKKLRKQIVIGEIDGDRIVTSLDMAEDLIRK